MGLLFLLFLILPAVELALLIQVGSHIGIAETIFLILATGAAGAWLARREGLQVLRQIERETAAGRMPAAALMDGMIVVIAGALLITPGILTDALGLLCLIPKTRRVLQSAMQRWLEARVQRGDANVNVHVTRGLWESRSGPIYDITPERADRDVRSADSSMEPRGPRKGD